MALGAALQCVEAATLGMPFEVWKTRMGRFQTETTMQAFWAVKERAGWSGFWQGTSAKMVESALKGAILLFSKEAIISASRGAGASEFQAGLLGGAGGGICQTTVMGPCTFLVIAMVTSTVRCVFCRTSTQRSHVLEKENVRFHSDSHLYRTLSHPRVILFTRATSRSHKKSRKPGLRREFAASTQAEQPSPSDKLATGRHGKGSLTAQRQQAKKTLGKEKLSTVEDVGCGIVGGALSTESAVRSCQDSSASACKRGKAVPSMPVVMANVVKESGPMGLFKGIVPRIGLGVWQTLFMVTGAKQVKEWMK